MLTEKTVRGALDAFASSDPTPGGGSAAALAGAMGSALLLMVARMPKTRAGSEEERTNLAAAVAVLAPLCTLLTNAMDADAAAYDRVVAAYRLPKATDTEKASRSAAIQRALHGATEVPLGVLRAAVEALRQARRIAAHGYGAAASDVGVAIAMLAAAARGAALNVDVNLGSLKDAGFVETVHAERQRLAAEADALRREGDALLDLGSR